MTARAVIVWRVVFRADALACTGTRVEQPLALNAPPPTALLASRIFVQSFIVMTARAVIMRTTCRTDTFTGAGARVEHTLALNAPPPSFLRASNHSACRESWGYNRVACQYCNAS